MNTCGLEGIVALADEGGVVREERLPGRGTSEHLMGAVRRVMGDVRVGELKAVGVVLGPGSFTGVRVGLAMAKGLCEAGGVGLVGMSRLGLIAGDGVGVLDAGRGEYFVGGGEVAEALVKTVEGLRELVTCEVRVGEVLGCRVVGEPGGAEMLEEVRRRVEVGDWSDVGAVDANYLRRTDAEIKVLG